MLHPSRAEKFKSWTESTTARDERASRHFDSSECELIKVFPMRSSPLKGYAREAWRAKRIRERLFALQKSGSP